LACLHVRCGVCTCFFLCDPRCTLGILQCVFNKPAPRAVCHRADCLQQSVGCYRGHTSMRPSGEAPLWLCSGGIQQHLVGFAADGHYQTAVRTCWCVLGCCSAGVGASPSVLAMRGTHRGRRVLPAVPGGTGVCCISHSWHARRCFSCWSCSWGLCRQSCACACSMCAPMAPALLPVRFGNHAMQNGPVPPVCPRLQSCLMLLVFTTHTSHTPQ
jgi:hypothetical protein